MKLMTCTLCEKGFCGRDWRVRYCSSECARKMKTIQNRKYEQANRAQRDLKNKTWAQKNPEKKREAVRKWRMRNTTKADLATARWRSANPEKILAQRQRAKFRRALLFNVARSLLQQTGGDYGLSR